MTIPTLWVRHPFAVPFWRREEAAAALAALVATDAVVSRFAAAFLLRIGAGQGVATGSGRFALELALRQAIVDHGDEVVLPTFGCGALVAAIAAAGGTPVFADVDRDLNLDPESVARALSPRTRAVIVVHAGGKRARVEQIASLVRDRGISVVEDFAQATGASSDGVRWPIVGGHAIYSFGPGKNAMATAGGFLVGDGGARSLATEAPLSSARRLAETLLRYRLARYTRPAFAAIAKLSRRASAPEDRSDPYPRVGLAPTDAAIMERQLAALSEIITLRRRNAITLRGALDGLPAILLPEPRDHVFTKFYIAFPASTAPPGERAPELPRIVRALLRSGFEPELAYVPLHQRFASSGRDVGCPVAEDLCPRLLTLPVRPGLEEADMLHLADALRRALRALRAF